MTHSLARLVATGAVLAMVVSPLHAQGRRIELGVDAALTVVRVEGINQTTINVPAQSLRAGFFLSDRISLEPTIAVNFRKVENTSVTFYGGGVGLLYHLSTDRDRPQVFLRPMIGYSGLRFVGGSSGVSIAGFGAGVKVPTGDRLAIRLGAEYMRRFEGGDVGALNGFAATVGLSFFTR